MIKKIIIILISVFLSLNVIAQPSSGGTVRLWDGTEIATVRDTGSSDSLNVAVVDASGNQVTSFGGGTQYTEDVAAAADPVGTMIIARRRDSPASEVSANGDNIAINATSNGSLRVYDDVTDGTLNYLTAFVEGWDNAASNGASFSGDVAHDTADAGEPVKIGHKAIAVGSTPTEVTANDRTDSYALRAGVPFTLNGHMNHLMASENITDADGAQSNVALITVSAGTKIVVTWYKVKCDQDNTGDYDFRMGFGTANTPALDNDGSLIADDPGIAPGSGVVSGQIFAIGGDDEDLRFDIDDPAGGACSITVNYFTTSS